jgi:hypothetical protein
MERSPHKKTQRTVSSEQRNTHVCKEFHAFDDDEKAYTRS